jgi:hypothetical protein
MGNADRMPPASNDKFFNSFASSWIGINQQEQALVILSNEFQLPLLPR